MRKGIMTWLSFLILNLALLNAAEQQAELHQKLNSTKINHYQIADDQSLSSAINQLVIRLRSEKAPAQLIKLVETVKIPKALKAKKIAKMGMEKASLAEILYVISHRAGMKWTVKNQALLLSIHGDKNGVSLAMKNLESIVMEGEFGNEFILRQGLNFLQSRTRVLAKPKSERQKRGLNLIVRSREVKKEGRELGEDEAVTDEFIGLIDRSLGEIRFTHLSVVELLNIMCKRCGAKWLIENGAIVILENKSSPK